MSDELPQGFTVDEWIRAKWDPETGEPEADDATGSSGPEDKAPSPPAPEIYRGEATTPPAPVSADADTPEPAPDPLRELARAQQRDKVWKRRRRVRR